MAVLLALHTAMFRLLLRGALLLQRPATKMGQNQTGVDMDALGHFDLAFIVVAQYNSGEVACERFDQ